MALPTTTMNFNAFLEKYKLPTTTMNFNAFLEKYKLKNDGNNFSVSLVEKQLPVAHHFWLPVAQGPAPRITTPRVTYYPWRRGPGAPRVIDKLVACLTRGAPRVIALLVACIIFCAPQVIDTLVACILFCAPLVII